MTAIEVSNIIGVADKEIEKACRLDGRGRTGGFLCVADRFGTILVCQIGVVTDLAAAERFRTACQEKATRLLQNKLHFSSWQSRDFDSKQYGGGILADTIIAFAFSGLSEHLDEAFSAVIASKTSARLTYERWDDIRSISQNPHMTTFGWLTTG